MIKTYEMIMDELSGYGNPKQKLGRLVKKGIYIPIVRGLYETDRNTPGYLLAGSIYGPSYLSFAFALSYYGLIPESVYTYSSATFDKKKKKIYQNFFGSFTYRDVPQAVFPKEIMIKQEKEYFFRIASPEKALCDQLYTISPAGTLKEMNSLLWEDLRMEKSDIMNLNVKVIECLAALYHSTNVNLLAKVMRKH
ncbi:MAG: hypothetical protein IJ694_07980 [Acidaminococcaceae bacterium]|nr:hypothetical protein [Acidaminococcaceae bacterium]HAT98597.1 hypothetical protein [Acidaminococcaceae bacterium]